MEYMWALGIEHDAAEQWIPFCIITEGSALTLLPAHFPRVLDWMNTFHFTQKQKFDLICVT